MKIFVSLLILTLSIIAGEFKLQKWQNGESFGGYLTRHGIDSTKFYNQIDPDDIKYLSDIQAGATFFENSDKNGLKEALIPLGEEMQIDVFKKGKEYGFDIIPIKYKTVKDKVSIKIENSCFADLSKATNNPNLATYLKKIFKNYVDFTKLQKGDSVSFSYTQKSIDKLPWGEPKITSALVKHKDIEYFAVLKKDDNYKIWQEGNTTVTKIVKKVKKVATKAKYKAFTNPLRKMRITSTFTYKRWHPILHRYRPHLGVDLGAKRGTPIHAIASGKVIYAGWMRGYGKVTKINHGGGIVSLYAHQSKLLVRVGQSVKARQVIGKIGSTGRSTGPHLHLGVYKYGRPVNPLAYLHKIIKIKSGTTTTTQSIKIVKNIKNLSKELPYKEKKVYNSLIKNDNKPFIWKDSSKTVKISIKHKESKNKNANRIKLSSQKGAA